MAFTVDIDTGGTFTDGFIVRGGEVRTVKVPTTPHDLTVCFAACIQAAADAFGLDLVRFLHEVDIIRFSNTIGTNTLIERDGSRIGLIVSAGRENLAPSAEAGGRPPLVSPDMVTGVIESVEDDGTVARAPEPDEVLEAAQNLIDKGARCLVVALTNSHLNAANERAVRDIIKREYPRDYLGSVPVYMSANATLHSDQSRRINAAVVNAYIHARLARLLYKAEEDLRKQHYSRTLFIGHNNGAVARVAKTRAINTYNSGPAAGLLGARETGRLYRLDNLISTDMGGTSFDVGCVRAGEIAIDPDPDIEGFRCGLPMISIRALGAGGGTIATVVDASLRVGPKSAGAMPGPACFGLGGTEPTVTDANLVLGILDPDYFLGGRMQLDVQKARDAIDDKVATPLAITVDEAAARIRAQINRSMGDAVTAIKAALALGCRPVIVAYGGAGGLHACDIAEAAGIDKVIMTPFAAVSSAFGSSLMDVGHQYYRRLDAPLRQRTTRKRILAAVSEMRREAGRDMRGEGFAGDSIHGELQLFVKDGAGRCEAVVPAPEDALANAKTFSRLIETAGKMLVDSMPAGAPKDGPVRAVLTLVGYRALAPVPHYRITEMPPARTKVDSARKGCRPVQLGDDRDACEVPVFERAKLGRGHAFAGPALVESDQTTLFVPPGWRLEIDRFDNAVLERAEGS